MMERRGVEAKLYLVWISALSSPLGLCSAPEAASSGWRQPHPEIEPRPLNTHVNVRGVRERTEDMMTSQNAIIYVSRSEVWFFS
jgi:hypothetical protein